MKTGEVCETLEKNKGEPLFSSFPFSGELSSIQRLFYAPKV